MRKPENEMIRNILQNSKQIGDRPIFNSYDFTIYAYHFNRKYNLPLFETTIEILSQSRFYMHISNFFTTLYEIFRQIGK